MNSSSASRNIIFTYLPINNKRSWYHCQRLSNPLELIMVKPAVSKRSVNDLIEPKARTSRLPPREREQQIADRAIKYFATHGFTGSTRELARELGITQPLLYRYFPSKQALIERVYREVYASRWNPDWDDLLVDRSRPFAERMRIYSRDYARSILHHDWVRIFIFAGLEQQGINTRYLDLLHRRIFTPILQEMIHEYGLQEPKDDAAREEMLEQIWGWHSSIFYLGVRKWVYGFPLPKDVDRLIDQRVDAFLHGVPALLRREK
jgi:AcrR family transcriptional regulator